MANETLTMAGLMEEFALVMTAVWILIALVWLLQAALAASLARQKGYSGTAGFFIALLLPGLGLIYEAGRPLSQDMIDEQQRMQAVRIAKAIKKSMQTQEKVFHSEEPAEERRRRSAR